MNLYWNLMKVVAQLSIHIFFLGGRGVAKKEGEGEVSDKLTLFSHLVPRYIIIDYQTRGGGNIHALT